MINSNFKQYLGENQSAKAKNALRVAVVVVVIAILGVAGFFYFKNNPTASNGKATTASNAQVKSQVITLNQSFNIPVDTGKPDSKPLIVTFQKAQLTNQILINGQSSFSKNGTKYLMLNLLIENDTTSRLNFLTRNVVRLIDTNNKKFAPSYYNGKDTALEPDSVKKDVVGFLVPDDIKDFKIQYGSLDGEKQILDLKFNK